MEVTSPLKGVSRRQGVRAPLRVKTGKVVMAKTQQKVIMGIIPVELFWIRSLQPSDIKPPRYKRWEHIKMV